MAKKKYVLIASDFYAEYELYRTSDVDGLRKITADYVKGGEFNLDGSKHELIATMDDITAEAARKIADEIIYIGELV